MCFDAFEDLDGTELPLETPAPPAPNGAAATHLPALVNPCHWSARQRLGMLALLVVAAAQYWLLLPKALERYYVMSANSLGLSVPVLGLPIINRPDLMFRMLRSIDFPVDTLLIVHNRDQGQPNEAVAEAVSQLKAGEVDLGHRHIRRVVVHTHSANIGVAASWNQIMIEEETAAYWLIAETDVVFTPGALAEVAHKMRWSSWYNSSCLWGLGGDPVSQYATFVVTQKALAAAGWFDENFWPAYSEDCDYTTRLLLAECPLHMEADAKRLILHGDANTTNYNTMKPGVDAAASWQSSPAGSLLYHRVVSVGLGRSGAGYLERKWGVNTCAQRRETAPFMSLQGVSSTPFGRAVGHDALRWWELDRKRRQQQEGPQTCIACHLIKDAV